ncbi:hypothetical protein ACWCQL_01495 [Streptomyces sp. NPDC002073]
MTVTVSGTRDGADWPAAGGVVDLPDGEAEQLVAAGLAQPAAVEVETAVETAAASDTAEKRGRGRPRLPRDADGAIVRE